MANLTISLEESIIKMARVRAIQEGTSVSAKVREFLAEYALGNDRQSAAATAFIEAARRSQANSEGVRWTRADAHERPYPDSATSANTPSATSLVTSDTASASGDAVTP
jgi:plasmid stability protein